ncbi:MAG: hemin uptake protein HemP [Pseudomonadota bacterium]
MTQTPTAGDPAVKTAVKTAVADQTPIYNALDLLQGSNTAQIVLNDSVYTLRRTRSGKLILTK